MNLRPGDPGPSLSLEVRADRVAVIRFDVPGRRLNVIQPGFADELDTALSRIAADDGIVAAVLVSGKSEGFCAGADLESVLAFETREDARRMVERAHSLFARLRDFDKPIVAAVHGAAMGGGFELALACRACVASSAEKTRFGLPEVKLGLIPAFHGLQELARGGGLRTALRCGLGGQSLSGNEARVLGIVSQLVVQEDVLACGIAMAQQLAAGAGVRKARRWDANWLIERAAFAIARRQSRHRTRGNHPAADSVIDVLEAFVRKGPLASYQLEREAFAELAVSSASRQLLSLFLDGRRQRERVGEGVDRTRRERVLVAPATSLGASVAALSAARLAVELCDEPSGASLAEAGIVIETCTGGLEPRVALLERVERETRPDTIFATTSGVLRVASVAQRAKRPQNVVGMFLAGSLLEVVKGPHTSPAAVRRAVSLGWAQQRTVVVTSDGAGRFSSRLRLAFINEAFFCLADGARVDLVTRATLDWGFAQDPFALLDLVGPHGAATEALALANAIGARMPIAPPLAAIAERGIGRGAFGRALPRVHSTQDVHTAVAERLGVGGARSGRGITLEEVQMRCALAFVNEAYHGLDEGIVASPDDGNIAAILGAGFPPFRGGPFRYAEALGLPELIDRLELFKRRLGRRFQPAPPLRARLDRLDRAANPGTPR